MMKKVLFVCLFSIYIISSCTKKIKVDLIVHNAKVYAVNESFDVEQAFAVKDGKFVAIGTDQEILSMYQSEVQAEADGKPVYPGFIDAHCHFYGYAMNLVQSVDLTETVSFNKVVERVREHHQKYPSEWIQGRGWDQNDWEVKEFPSKELLDLVFPENPVYLTRIDGHAAIVNSATLKLAGITAETRIEGGEIIVKDGEPTGILIDNVMDMVSKIIPETDEDFQRNALKAAERNCFAVGLTSVQDAGLGRINVDLIDRMHQEGSLKIRIYAMLNPTRRNMETYISKGIYLTERLTVRSIKLYADGALGSRGAKMTEPYSDDPSNTGMFMYSPQYYDSICALALEKGYQVNTHAIGDEGNRFVLNLYVRYLKDSNDRRWRIEHAQVVHPEDFHLFGEYSIIPSVQPTHATSDMYWAEERIGAERIKGAYAYQNLLRQNGWLPLGTDFPVESINPLFTFYAAVTRKDLEGKPENGFQIENALSREEALRGMTIWAAKAAFEEHIKGSIEPGKFADFVILDKDIMVIDLNETKVLPQVMSVYLGGEKVF
jgi:predicted amidohydrolase YtcJ